MAAEERLEASEPSKRSVKETYQPSRILEINLTSVGTSSAAALPGGETYDHYFSSDGRCCLIIGSSRIGVLDLVSDQPVLLREYEIARRPLKAALNHDGTKLVLLTSEHRVDLFDLSKDSEFHLRSLSLVDRPHAIALSPGAEVLAISTDQAIELHSLVHPEGQEHVRTVQGDRLDDLVFSADGNSLLGTTIQSRYPAAVIINAPYYIHDEPAMAPAEYIASMWTQQLLFPNGKRDLSHAVLLPALPEDISPWMLVYDQIAGGLRVLDSELLRDFDKQTADKSALWQPQPTLSGAAFAPLAKPAVTQNRRLVAVPFADGQVWLFTNLTDMSTVDGQDEANGEDLTSEMNAAKPSWQVIRDITGRAIDSAEPLFEAKSIKILAWVANKGDSTQSRDRLIAALGRAPGQPVHVHELGEAEAMSPSTQSGGKIIVADFEAGPSETSKTEMTIELGTGSAPKLVEEQFDLEKEIAIVRRRTTIRRSQTLRASTMVDQFRSDNDEDIPAMPSIPDQYRRSSIQKSSGSFTRRSQSMYEPTIEQAAEALGGGGYGHQDPRSRDALYRSTTAVVARREREGSSHPGERVRGPIEFRRTDGTELPHESDADHWVPPPPPYTQDVRQDLPSYLRPVEAQISENGTEADVQRALRSMARLPLDQRSQDAAATNVEPNEPADTSNQRISQIFPASEDYDLGASLGITDFSDDSVEESGGTESPAAPLAAPRPMNMAYFYHEKPLDEDFQEDQPSPLSDVSDVHEFPIQTTSSDFNDIVVPPPDQGQIHNLHARSLSESNIAPAPADSQSSTQQTIPRILPPSAALGAIGNASYVPNNAFGDQGTTLTVLGDMRRSASHSFRNSQMRHSTFLGSGRPSLNRLDTIQSEASRGDASRQASLVPVASNTVNSVQNTIPEIVPDQTVVTSHVNVQRSNTTTGRSPLNWRLSKMLSPSRSLATLGTQNAQLSANASGQASTVELNDETTSYPWSMTQTQPAVQPNWAEHKSARLEKKRNKGKACVVM